MNRKARRFWVNKGYKISPIIDCYFVRSPDRRVMKLIASALSDSLESV
jgi:hypothetical protein